MLEYTAFCLFVTIDQYILYVYILELILMICHMNSTLRSRICRIKSILIRATTKPRTIYIHTLDYFFKILILRIGSCGS